MQLILQTQVKREQGKLYFCKGDPIGIFMAEPGRKKQKPIIPEDDKPKQNP